ncbi:hypothetical protein BC943DRAFT_224061 [Umbelopsis sp. AD052]|nr:hypothetical protein BC943DRAFT_224061 [Umbelopsis sp. AD052]
MSIIFLLQTCRALKVVTLRVTQWRRFFESCLFKALLVSLLKEKKKLNTKVSISMRQQQRPRQQSTSVLNNSEQRLHNQVRHLVHNNPASKMSRSRNNPTSDHSLSVGYVRDLEQCQESELIEIRKKNMHILGNPTIVATLPDKGEKLRATNIVIDSLLAQLKPDGNFQTSPLETAIQEPSDDKDIDDAPLTDAISKLTLKNKENGREHSVALANAQASNNQYVSSGMMRTRKASVAEGSSNDTSNDANAVSATCFLYNCPTLNM